MPTFILHFGEQRHFASERGGTGNPVAFRLHPNDFRIGVLCNLADQCEPIRFRHPMIWFDFLLSINPRLKCGQSSRIIGRGRAGIGLIKSLSIHANDPIFRQYITKKFDVKYFCNTLSRERRSNRPLQFVIALPWN
jgi:hypothetical protein